MFDGSISIGDYHGVETTTREAADKLLKHFKRPKIDSAEKKKAILQLEASASQFKDLSYGTFGILSALREKVKLMPKKRSAKKLMKILSVLPTFIPRIIPQIPVRPPLAKNQSDNENDEVRVATLMEDFVCLVLDTPNSLTAPAVLINHELTDPVNEQETAFRKLQEEYFVGIATLFINDYFIGESQDPFDILLKREIATTLQPSLLEAVKSFCFPTPGKTGEEEKVYLRVAIQQLDLFLEHLGKPKKDPAKTLHILNEEREKLDLPPFYPLGSLELAKTFVDLLHQILDKTFKIQDSKAAIPTYVLANKWSHLIFTLTQPGILQWVIEALLKETIDPIDIAPPLELFDASDPDFSKNTGQALFQLGKKIIALGNPKGATKIAVNYAESSMANNTDVIGEVIQKILSRLAQSSSRLNLFYILSFIFWQQTEDSWHPKLNEILKEKTFPINEEKFVSLLNSKLLSLIGVQVKEDSSYIGWAAAKFVEFEGSIPSFTEQLSKTIATLLLNQSSIYAILYVLEGISNYLNKGSKNEN